MQNRTPKLRCLNERPVPGFRLVLFASILLVSFLLAGCGEKYRAEGNALSKQIYALLIKNGYCKNYDECYAKEVMYGEAGDRVYLSIYGVSDQKILGEVLYFVVTEGRQVTNGVPISVSVFLGQKREYINSINKLTAKPSIHLEVN